MVAMTMTYKYRKNLVEMLARASELNLRAFAAVYHKLLATHLHHLRRREMLYRGQSTSTTEYVNLEWFHFFL
jgi:hypothetical protein